MSEIPLVELSEDSSLEEVSLVEDVSSTEEEVVLLEEALANSLRYSNLKERE
jgi:hypothetical protein